VLKKSEKAAPAASSVHVDADITDDDVELSIDMRMQSDGKRAAGSISSDGQTVQVRVLDQAVYFKADRDFWVDAANAEAAELFTGKWVKGRTVDSQETVGLREKGTQDPGTLYVAQSDKPYPLLVVPDAKPKARPRSPSGTRRSR